jgi:manganese oxidase
MISRRKFFSNAAVVAGAAALGAATRSVKGAEPVGRSPENPEKINDHAQSDQQDYPPGEPGKDYTPVITPNGSTLPFKVVGGVKVFHLITEEVDHEFAPGLRAYCWGFNGQVHGPTIEVVEGDRDPHLRHEQPARKYQYSLAWCVCALRYGRSGGT